MKRDACGDAIATHILATIDHEPELPITADWLREVWGGKDTDDPNDYPVRQIEFYTHNGSFKMWQYGDEYWLLNEMDKFPFHTRQQFCDLARALGIQRTTTK